VRFHGNLSVAFRMIRVTHFIRKRGGDTQLAKHPSNVLVFRIGSLGDTIVALPSLWAVREHFRQARLRLLSEQHPHDNRVLAKELLTGAGLFDDYLLYPVDNSTSGRWLRPLRMLRLLVEIRAGGFDALVYLAPSLRTADQVARDRRYFAIAGIKRFFGMRGFPSLPRKIGERPMPAVPFEAELLLARLAADGIPIPQHGDGRFELGLGSREEQQMQAWVRQLAPDQGRNWIGIGAGSNQPANRWPVERYSGVVKDLIRQFDVWPVVFGGSEDQQTGNALLRDWGRGYNAAGCLSVRAAAVALKRCSLYLGNNTGTMHLAAAVGTLCAAVHSARDFPGSWYPYGQIHRVFRSPIDCEGCHLKECVERRNECLTRIKVEDVVAACSEVLAERCGKQSLQVVSQGNPLQQADGAHARSP